MYKLSMTLFNDEHIEDYNYLKCLYKTIPSNIKVYHYHYSELEELISKINKEIEIDRKLEISELEAKVYAYEKIIANSNFKTILEDNKIKKKTKKRGEDK